MTITSQKVFIFKFLFLPKITFGKFKMLVTKKIKILLRKMITFLISIQKITTQTLKSTGDFSLVFIKEKLHRVQQN